MREFDNYYRSCRSRVLGSVNLIFRSRVLGLVNLIIITGHVEEEFLDW